jgi:hypothetical protein
LPWKYFIKRAARSYGVIDPLRFMARLRRFAQPSEVQEPIELLRAGIVFHARGLINTKAIQHNLDWIWPFWVEKQFNPKDFSFIPRAFSFSHVNLTHRNWTAVGHPGLAIYPLVDPRGLITPFFDSWSLDFWIIDENGRHLLPSKEKKVRQEWRFNPNLEVLTSFDQEGQELQSSVLMEIEKNSPRVSVNIDALSTNPAWLVVSLRPYNPEGVQFVERVDFDQDSAKWLVNNKNDIFLSEKPERVLHSEYNDGDVFHKITEKSQEEESSVKCEVGMATAAALYPLQAGSHKKLQITIPISTDKTDSQLRIPAAEEAWDKTLQDTASLQVPDDKIQFLYDAAVRSLLLLSADDIVPGPYTYKRFWFRDACLMLHALLVLGASKRTAQQIDKFPQRQKYTGYFHSQEGEWDSNGQVLWLLERYQELSGQELKADWWSALEKGVDWIKRKRLTKVKDAPHAGLMPAGFSAEHFGPNDYYYWDNFWSLAGLQAASRLAQERQHLNWAEEITNIAEQYQRDIQQSISSIPEQRKKGAIPASPYRRMDAGAIGSLVADYPLQLYSVSNPETLNTAEFLLNNCFHAGGFFQDMIHSGINPYLTLAIAQTLLRHHDPGFQKLVETVANLATSTGQWPEAIHPITGGGCMGDGQHGWAAAEWIMIIRNMFVREENDCLILFSGVFPSWLESKEDISFGPTLTPYGPVSVSLQKNEGEIFATVDGQWRNKPSQLIIAAPGYEKMHVFDASKPLRLQPITNNL